jgi:hypothetical protein
MSAFALAPSPAQTLQPPPQGRSCLAELVRDGARSRRERLPLLVRSEEGSVRALELRARPAASA